MEAFGTDHLHQLIKLLLSRNTLLVLTDMETWLKHKGERTGFSLPATDFHDLWFTSFELIREKKEQKYLSSLLNYLSTLLQGNTRKMPILGLIWIGWGQFLCLYFGLFFWYIIKKRILLKYVAKSEQQNVALKETQNNIWLICFLSQTGWPAEVNFPRTTAFPFEVPKVIFVCINNHSGETVFKLIYTSLYN